MRAILTFWINGNGNSIEFNKPGAGAGNFNSDEAVKCFLERRLLV
mgnify:CR=1 FL=1